MTGQSVLQTNSPYNRVNTALMSANKSKQVIVELVSTVVTSAYSRPRSQLARRLYYSFRQTELDHLRLEDIARL